MIAKVKRPSVTVQLSKTKIDGLRISPKNKVDYPGIQVNSMLIIKPALIDKVLKKKNKRTLDKYLQYLITLVDGESDDEAFRQALNNLTRYREIIDYKYRKFLDDKYINLLLKKVDLLEHEIKSKMIYQEQLRMYQQAKQPIKDIPMQTELVEEKGKSR